MKEAAAVLFPCLLVVVVCIVALLPPGQLDHWRRKRTHSEELRALDEIINRERKGRG